MAGDHTIDHMMEWFGENYLPSDDTYARYRMDMSSGILLYAGFLFAFFLVCLILRRIRSPRKPLITCFLDTVLYVPYLLKIGPWANDNDIDNALKSAMFETKLLDFGLEDEVGKSNGVSHTQIDNGYGVVDPTDFIKRYKMARKYGLIKSKTHYSPIGYVLTGQILHRRMVARLRHVDYIKRHPQITNIPVRTPIFVIGFPRTGTTYLHELLGLHPTVRMHYTWEQLEHVPRTHNETIDAQKVDRLMRFTALRHKFNMMLKLVGNAIQQIHRIGYDEPEECTTPCAVELPYALGELPLYIFAFKETLPLGCGKAFHFYKEYLQLLTFQQAGSPGGLPKSGTTKTNMNGVGAGGSLDATSAIEPDFTWMLKCPFHLPYLKELFEAFPDATVVWTHRDPVECIGSACSLYETLVEMGMESYSIDTAAIGSSVLEYTRLSLDMAEKVLQAGGSKVIHVRYQDTVAKPKDVVSDIFTQAWGSGRGKQAHVSPEYKAKLDDYLSASKIKRMQSKNAHGGKKILHSYSLEKYGLTEQQVREEFQWYTDKYRLRER